jgi:hypothetical protein
MLAQNVRSIIHPLFRNAEFVWIIILRYNYDDYYYYDDYNDPYMYDDYMGGAATGGGG